MKIEFRKVPYNSSPFSIKIEDISIDGSFKKIRTDEVEIKLDMHGSTKHICDICGEEFDLICDEKSTLIISDGEYSGDEIDVIETFDHYVDIDYIIESEIEAYKSDYHYCENCKNKMKE